MTSYEMMLKAGTDIRAAHYSAFLQMYKLGETNIRYASSFDLRRRWFHSQT
jgi:sialate O-acetylesterase